MRVVAPVDFSKSFLNSSTRAGCGQPKREPVGLAGKVLPFMVTLIQSEDYGGYVVSLPEDIEFPFQSFRIGNIAAEQLRSPIRR